MNKKNIAIILAIVIILGAGVFFVNSLYLNDDFDGGNVNSFDNGPALNDTDISDNNISGSDNGIKQNNQKINPVNSKKDVNNNKTDKNDSIWVKPKISKKEAIKLAEIYLNSCGFTNLEFKRILYNADSWHVEFYDLDNKRILFSGVDGITGEILQPD